MTNASEKPSEPSLPVSSASVEPDAKQSPKKAPEVSPTLEAYFGEKKVAAGAFIKAIRIGRLKRFTQDDETQALELMEKHDTDGDRLWMLLSQSKLPEAIDRWIWKVTQDRLVKVIGPGFNPSSQSSGQALDALRVYLLPYLETSEGNKRKIAETWVRIGICWLMQRLSLDAWLVADQMNQTLFKKPADAKRIAVAAIQRGRPVEFKHAVAIAGLARSTVETVQRERDEERRNASGLRNQLAQAKAEIEALRLKVAELKDEVATTSASLATTKSQLEAERLHWGHDLTETKAGQQALLQRRVAPLLADAIDALEIEPPAPEIAIQRLKNVISIIDGAQQ